MRFTNITCEKKTIDRAIFIYSQYLHAVRDRTLNIDKINQLGFNLTGEVYNFEVYTFEMPYIFEYNEDVLYCGFLLSLDFILENYKPNVTDGTFNINTFVDSCRHFICDGFGLNLDEVKETEKAYSDPSLIEEFYC